MAGKRRNLHVRVTDESFDGWTAFANRHGVSLAALVEAMGVQLGETLDPESEPGWKMVEQARRIDAERRSRRAD